MTKTCPKCGHMSFVYNSRDQVDRIWRRRFCGSEQCAERWSTYEITEELFNKLTELQTMKEKIKELAESL